MASNTLDQDSLSMEALRWAVPTLRGVIRDRIHKINNGKEFSDEFMMDEIDSLVKASVTVALVDAGVDQ